MSAVVTGSLTTQATSPNQTLAIWLHGKHRNRSGHGTRGRGTSNTQEKEEMSRVWTRRWLEEMELKEQQGPSEELRVAESSHEPLLLSSQRNGAVGRIPERRTEMKGKHRNWNISLKGKEKECVQIEQYVVFNESNLVSVGSGLEVYSIIPGFDLCRLTIRHLPSFITTVEVIDLLIQNGMPTSDFFILPIHDTRNAKEVVIITSKDRGRAAASQIDGTEFQGKILRAEVSENFSRHTLQVSEHSSGPYLTVDWKNPTGELIASYPSVEDAEKRSKDLNGMFWMGYRIKAALYERRRGSATKSIKITNYPPDATSDEEFIEFIGTDSYKFSKAKLYDQESSLSTVRDHLRQQIGVKMDTYEEVALDNPDTTKIKVYFQEWQDVGRAYASVHHRKLGSDKPTPTLRGWHPRPIHYSIKIPRQQYTAQKRQWDALAEVVPEREVYLQTRTGDRGDSIFIHIQGNEKRIVGAMKVRVEKLVVGGTLGVECWHPSFLTTSRRTKVFLDRVQTATGIYVTCDPDMQTFRVYGEPEMIQDARSMIVGEVERRGAVENREAVVLDGVVTSRRRSISTSINGRDEMKHLINGPFEQSNLIESGKGICCALCFNDASNPEHLHCGHSYCGGCMQHFLSSAEETKRFPVVCIGNDAKCHSAIPTQLIRKFVKTDQAFQKLLEAAFTGYIEQRPQDYRWCATPDCMQVYRRQGQKEELECPSCFLTICAACEASHEGLTCAERQMQHDPEAIERRNRQLGYRKCPHCNAWIEKTGGCNHVSCTCGTHICWRCMKSFPISKIYSHINSVICKPYVDVAPTARDAARRRGGRLSGNWVAPETPRARWSTSEDEWAYTVPVATVERPDPLRRARDSGCIVM